VSILKGKRIGFFGGGKMAEAMIQGLVAGGVLGRQILVYDVDARRRSHLRKTYRVQIAKSNIEVAASSGVVVIAVKPQNLEKVFKEIGQLEKPKSGPLFISIVAGVPLRVLRSWLGKSAGSGGGARLVRVMPNTPALIQQGISAFYMSPNCTASDKKTAVAILAAMGEVVEVKDEKLLDPVTGLSGSGPAYFYVIIEALADAGVKMGLSRDVALRLAACTAAGAARMVLETGVHPGELKDMVTSPGGTTAAGLSELEKGGLRGLLIRAVEAATKRSEELGQKSEGSGGQVNTGRESRG
jgi:pyrroline-5-carboxylate reductase